jgi:hypothetical protein
VCAANEPNGRTAPVSFDRQEGKLRIAIGSQAIAEYVYQDDQILRPYFRHLKTPMGAQVTRNHPPVAGKDLDDHPAMHPGLWLAFGDLGGADFWRNKARVRHVGFVAEPRGTPGSGSFTVRNVYDASGQSICTEDCTITISARPDGFVMTWDSSFRSERAEFAFGDQEEMGLGVRVATPLAVVNGGQIIDGDGRRNGAQVWGTQSDWCHYGGVVNGQRVGVVLMPHPQNFRRSWFHARDYGLLVANPFGQNAFTKGEKSRITVEQGETLRLRFGVLVYGMSADEQPDIGGAFREFAAN